MKAMTQAARSSAGLGQAAAEGRLQGSLTPAVFGCPYDHTAGIVASPLPLSRCHRCAAPLTVVEGGLPRRGDRRPGRRAARLHPIS